MNPADPNNWKAIVDASAYTVQGMIKAFDLCPSTVAAWFRDEDLAQPRKATIEKMTPIMEKIQTTKPLEKHPSYGYTTFEQRQVMLGSLTPEREAVMRQVRLQGENKGKLFA